MKSINKFTLFILVSFLMATMGFSQQTMIYGYQGDDESYFNSLPQMVLTPQSAATTLPSEVDNSQQIFFPHYENGEMYMYDQTGTGSCIYVTSIYYAYAYEYNRLKGLAGNTPQTRFAPNSLYNHINGGQPDTPSDFATSLPLMQEYGVASEAVWGNLEPLDYLRWQSGYDAYHQRLLHRIEGYTGIYVGYNKVDLIPLKHYINDHNEGGNSIGGVIPVGVYFWGPPPSTLSYPSAYNGEKVKINIIKVATGHAVTIVGYCDDVKYDVNGDGLFTDNIDITGDGTVDLRDSEIGAFKVVNNYGLQSNNGFDWVLNRCFYNTHLVILTPAIDYSPKLELKVKISHMDRAKFLLRHKTLDKANTPSPSFPSNWPATTIYELSHANCDPNTPPAYPIRGAIYDPISHLYTNDYEPIEYIIDETDKIMNNTHVGKYEILGYNSSTPSPDNKIIYFSLIDYRWNEVFELECDQHDVQLINTLPFTRLAIEYDLIPHESPIVTTTTFNSNMVSRFSPVFTGNQTYTIANDVRFDMYNSTITLEQGSSLSLGNNVIIRGKRGANKFVIKGNILPMGTNVKFEAEPGSTLEVIYENPTVAGLLENCIFPRSRAVCPEVKVRI